MDGWIDRWMDIDSKDAASTYQDHRDNPRFIDRLMDGRIDRYTRWSKKSL